MQAVDKFFFFLTFIITCINKLWRGQSNTNFFDRIFFHHLHSELYIEKKERTFFCTSNAIAIGGPPNNFICIEINFDCDESMESLDNSIDNKRIEKSLSLLTRKFVELLLASKNGILDLKVVSTK